MEMQGEAESYHEGALMVRWRAMKQSEDEMRNAESQVLNRLRRQIPTFQCKPGCQDCCGPIVWTKAERERLISHLAGPATATTCEYILKEGTGRCAVYSERPVLCRLFGASEVPLLRCPHGCKPAKTLSIEETRQIMKLYTAMMMVDEI